MYGYVSDGSNEITEGIILDECEEFALLKLLYPEHEIYLFAGKKIGVALFFAPGVSAMLIETRASPDKIF
jgi:hypothetical protein